jgi:alkylation response protein AidB-like acyl-CoA dehydrogenase
MTLDTFDPTAGELSQAIASFAQTELGPRVAALDLFPSAMPTLTPMAALGPLGLPGLAHDAPALSLPELAAIVWSLGRTCAGLGAYVAQAAIAQRWAQRLGVIIDGKPVALALQEAVELLADDGEGDVALAVAAHVRGGLESEARLVARKRAVPLASEASAVAILARRDSRLGLAWVSRDELKVGAPVPLLGTRAMPCADLEARDARLLAWSDLSNLEVSRLFAELSIALLASAGGSASASAEAASQYAQERHQGGVLIERHEPVALLVAAIHANVACARAVLVESASALERDVPGCVVDALRARGTAGRAIVRATTDAVQVLGGYGYMRELGLEKRMRDAVTLSLLPLDGTRAALLAARLEREANP